MRRGLWAMTLYALLLAGCERQDPNYFQGYAEGEFVYVSSPLPGELTALHVARGDHVQAGQLLFELDSTSERAARDEAERRLAQAVATLEDLRKGVRPSELAALEAQLLQARAAWEYAESEYQRLDALVKTGGASVQEHLRAQTASQQARWRVAQLEAEVKTAQLGARPDQLAAAEAEVAARKAALERAEWNLAQKRQAAPQEAQVFDTLFRPGEQVPANRPIVALLPPANIKVRAFVPQDRVSTIQPGDAVEVRADGLAQTLVGKVSYISPRAEFTPPVIYSRDTRQKLVFMIEATFDPETASQLHPGQPVDVVIRPNP